MFVTNNSYTVMLHVCASGQGATLARIWHRNAINTSLQSQSHLSIGCLNFVSSGKVDTYQAEYGMVEDEETASMRKCYWKLAEANQRCNASEQSAPQLPSNRPVTCFLHPGLTPSKLLDHLKEKGASDACIVHWMRKLREARQGQGHDKGYNIQLMGK